jgi:hypothetical protein
MKKEKFFHELTYAERFDIYNRRLLIGHISRKYPRPHWCKNDQALDGLSGCDDLWMGAVKSEEDCSMCEYYRGRK